MALNASHDDMPKADGRNWPPDATPRFGHRLAEAWARQNEEQFHKPTRLGTKLRVSGAGQCARMTGYRALGIAKTEPTTLSGYWRMGLGTMVHSLLEPVMAKAFPGALIEFEIDYRGHEQFPLDMSGSGDVSLRYSALAPGVEQIGDTITGTPTESAESDPASVPASKRIVVEWKTINGYGFKLMTGARKGFGGVDETGPKKNHIVQAALEGYAEDADEVVLCYLSFECLSENEAKKLGTDDIGKFIAEFTIPREGPTGFVAIAEAELRRSTRMMELIDAGELPPRSLPDLHPKARIVDPLTGRWELRTPDGASVVDSGEHWQCPSYCDWRSQCIKDGPS